MALFQKLSLLVRPQLHANVSEYACSSYQIYAQTRKKQEHQFLKLLRGQAHKDSLIVYQLPYKAAKEDVESYFSEFGSIEYVKFPFDRDGIPCKCAEVKFSKPEALEQVRRVGRHEVCDSRIQYNIPQHLKKKKDDFSNASNTMDDLI